MHTWLESATHFTNLEALKKVVYQCIDAIRVFSRLETDFPMQYTIV